MAVKTVEGYIEGLVDWKGEIVHRVRSIILETVPGVNETIKWAQPVYESGGPFAYIKAYKTAVNFGFWRGAELEDPHGVLQGTGSKMRHLKITDPRQVDEQLFADFIRQAVKLNRDLGDPTKSAGQAV